MGDDNIKIEHIRIRVVGFITISYIYLLHDSSAALHHTSYLATIEEDNSVTMTMELLTLACGLSVGALGYLSSVQVAGTI